LATVNGVPITVEEFEEAAARKTPENGVSLSDAEKQEILDRLVAEKLLYKAALEKGLDKDPKVQKVMVNTLLRELVYSQVRNSDFTDEELQAYYEAHKEDFVVPEKVQIRRILIKVKDDRPDEEARKEAERIHALVVANPESFKDLATQYSEDPYRRRGGDVGFVSRAGKPGLDDEVVAKAFEMQVGDISDVFKTEDGYNIITVVNKRERVERTFQQMKGSVLRKVKNEKLKELYDQYVNDLKAGAKIDIDTDKLAQVEVTRSRRPMGPSMSLGSPGAPAAPKLQVDKQTSGDASGDKQGDATEGGQ
ncbi:MAG: hypothetical protein D6798_10950, partial [Deltaproteobacteria bacterium]